MFPLHGPEPGVAEHFMLVWWAGHFAGVLLTLCFRQASGRKKNPQKPLPPSLGEISDILPALCNQRSAQLCGKIGQGLVAGGRKLGDL